MIPAATNQVTLRIPTPLRSLTGGSSSIAIEATTVGDALRGLESRFEDLRGRILEPNGEVRGFVNVFLGDTDIRRLAGLDTPTPAGATLSILPAVAGGRR